MVTLIKKQLTIKTWINVPQSNFQHSGIIIIRPHQAAVQKAMKRDQHDLKNDLEAATDWNDLEVIQAALDNVKIHDSVEECVTLPLPDLM